MADFLRAKIHTLGTQTEALFDLWNLALSCRLLYETPIIALHRRLLLAILDVRWYVLHLESGFEDDVSDNLSHALSLCNDESQHVHDLVQSTLIPNCKTSMPVLKIQYRYSSQQLILPSLPPLNDSFLLSARHSFLISKQTPAFPSIPESAAPFPHSLSVLPPNQDGIDTLLQ